MMDPQYGLVNVVLRFFGGPTPNLYRNALFLPEDGLRGGDRADHVPADTGPDRVPVPLVAALGVLRGVGMMVSMGV